MKKYFLVIFLFALLINVNCFAQEEPEPDVSNRENGSGEINEQNEDPTRLRNIPPGHRMRRRPHGFGYQFTGIGIIGGIGASRFKGDVSFEQINGQALSDANHDDDYNHLTTYSIGLRYAHRLAMFMFFGYNLDITYQRLGIEIDNDLWVVGGSSFSGSTENLSLEYLVITPSLTFNFMSFGFYFAFLTKAELGDKSVYDKINKFDFGCTVSVDVTFPFKGRKFGLSIIFEGMFGFLNVLKDDNRTSRNLAFNFKIAYLFGI